MFYYNKYKNVLLYLFLIVLSIFLGSSCIHFKVKHLVSNEIAKLSINGDNLNYPKQNGSYYELPYRVGIQDNIIVINEASSGNIKIFKKNKLELIIKSGKNVSDADKKKGSILQTTPIIYNDILNIPGMVVMGDNDDFFVQNYFTFQKDLQNKKKDIIENSIHNEAKGFYNILHFDITGKLIKIIGRGGNAEYSFENIIWMDVDTDNNLWVLHRYLDELYLENINKDSLLKHEIKNDVCQSVLFGGVYKDSTTHYTCEKMYPFYNGTKVVFIGKVEQQQKNSQKLTFINRVVKVKNLKSNEIVTIFSNLNDPESFPYFSYDNQYILLQETKDYNIFKYAVYNLSGDLINNLQIETSGQPSSWRSTYLSLSGVFYSLRLRSNSLYIYEWK